MSDRKIEIENNNYGMTAIAIVLMFVLFSGDPDIVDSLRVMAAKAAGIDPFPVQPEAK